MKTSTYLHLENLFKENFTTKNLSSIKPDEFKNNILARLNTVDSESEGYDDPSRQRDLSIKYHWGHNHDFGDFNLKGAMGRRHIHLIANFVDNFGLPLNLEGKRVLDIGVWTGGSSLLLSAMGAEVDALEEVKKYADTVTFLAESFGLDKLNCRAISLYDLDEHDKYDYIVYAGVIYHVTDPILSLRILFNALKDNGNIYIETFGIKSNSTIPIVRAEGPVISRGGSQENLNRSGWNYFIPSTNALSLWCNTVGFEDIRVQEVDSNSRIHACATRKKHYDMLRAGLSRATIR